MNQAYLAIAREHLAGGLVLEDETSGSDLLTPEDRSQPNETSDSLAPTGVAEEAAWRGAGEIRSPVPIAAYRTNGSVRRCHLCAHVLSVVAVRDVCGRCALRSEDESESTESSSPGPRVDPNGEPARRGQALVALDRRHYPRLHLPDGRTVERGLEAWAPVLREMNAEELLELARLVERIPTAATTPESEP